MIDLAGILFSSIMMFLVILRAIQLDSLEEWFRRPKPAGDRSGLKLRPDGPDGERKTGWRTEPRRE